MSQTPSFHSPSLPRSFKKQLFIIVPILICTVIGAGLLTALQLTQESQDLNKQAAPATALTLSTVADPVVINQIFTVPITINTGSNLVRALDLALNYDPAILQLQDVTADPWLIQGQVVTKKIDQATGTALVSLVVPPTAQPNYVTGTGTVAIATFKAMKASSRTTVNFNRFNSVVGAANEPQNVITNYVDVALTVLAESQLPTSDNLIVYSYEPCLSQNSDGHQLFILWRSSIYSGADAIEVSSVSSFATYAAKSTVGTKLTVSGWSAVDGTNFRTTNVGGANPDQVFTFNPEATYYFRVHYDSNKYSGVLAYKPASCSATPSIHQCNDSCNNSSECGTNLICSNHKCRRDGNPDDTQCFLPPDRGIKRACNEYCADSKECGSDFTCWYNQCRHPKDVTLANCKLPLAAGEVESCNHYCADSSECAGGLTCWYNQCRLAQNLKNEKCQLPPQPTRVSATNSATTTRSSAKFTPTPTRPKVTAKVIIDPQPTAAPTSSYPTSAPTVKPTIRPTTSPTLANLPPPNIPPANPFGWVPAVLGVIVIIVIGLIAWPRIQTAVNPPKARVIPPTPPAVPPAAPPAKPVDPSRHI